MQLLFLRQWFPDDVLKALSWTFVHSLWQGLLAAMLAAVIITVTRKAAARLRYNLLTAVWLVFLISVIISFCRELGPGNTAQQTTNPVNTAVTRDFSSVPATGDTVVITAEETNWVADFMSWVDANADLFVLAWTLFFILNCLKLFTGLVSVHRLRHYKTHAFPEEWRTKLDHLSKILGIRRSIALLQSELVKVPVAIGFFKPVILVPLGLVSHLPPEQVETILLHELAHIRRKDYLINLLQRMTEAIFFFNPALLWISSLIRQEREACCDDIVVANITQKRNYLEALVSFQEYSITASAYALGISSKRHYLLDRVKRMVTRENKKLSLVERLMLVVGVTMLTAFTFISQQEQEEPVVKQDPPAIIQQPVTPVKPVPANLYKGKKTAKPLRQPVKRTTLSSVPPSDTVPRRKDSTISFEGKKISITKREKKSTGQIKQETIHVMVADEKKYIIEKENGQITGLLTDNKRIEPTQIGNYKQLFQKVENKIAQDESSNGNKGKRNTILEKEGVRVMLYKSRRQETRNSKLRQQMDSIHIRLEKGRKEVEIRKAAQKEKEAAKRWENNRVNQDFQKNKQENRQSSWQITNENNRRESKETQIENRQENRKDEKKENKKEIKYEIKHETKPVTVDPKPIKTGEKIKLKDFKLESVQTVSPGQLLFNYQLDATTVLPPKKEPAKPANPSNPPQREKPAVPAVKKPAMLI